MASSMPGISPMVKSESPLYHRCWLHSYKNFSSGNRYVVVNQVIVALQHTALITGSFWCPVPPARMSGGTILTAKAGCLLVSHEHLQKNL